jgi:SAM-dependent methyltransferase
MPEEILPGKASPVERRSRPRTEPIAPGDHAGAETLELLAEAPQYNRWQFDVVAPFLGKRILEVGAGIGNMSEQFLEGRPELLVATDTDAYYRSRLEERFAGSSVVTVESLSMPDPSAGPRFAKYRLDTVIATNVVEHIEDDLGTVRTMRSLLAPGGRAVILVPALQSIYGEMDRELGHYRRYGRARLRLLMERAGLRIERIDWFNRAGVFGWWFNGRVRRVGRIPLDQLRTFDRLVPMLRLERFLPLPFGQSLIAVGRAP